jgi:hypothetical protein
MSLSVHRRKLLGGLLASAGLAGCGLLSPKDQANSFIPLPVLDLAIPLRVVYAHNPRFERAAPGLIANILARATEQCKSHLGLQLEFDEPQEQSLGTLFSGVTPTLWNQLKQGTYSSKNGAADRDRLVKTTQTSLAQNRSDLASQIAFAKPYLVSAIVPTDPASLARALVDTQLARYAAWQAMQGSDGQPLLDGSFYNEFFAWVFAPRAKPWAFEVVITNQLLASVEYLDNSLHSALRGGVSNGLTAQSPGSRYGTVSTLSLFPFTNQDPLTRTLRSDVSGTPTHAIEAAAAMLTHELGHQLLHLGHPFNSKACVMNPPELFQFEAWTRGLDAALCPLGNHAENKPGAHRFITVKRSAV